MNIPLFYNGKLPTFLYTTLNQLIKFFALEGFAHLVTPAQKVAILPKKSKVNRSKQSSRSQTML